jgi:3-methyladenine DNA glycosylase AlkD
MFVIKSVKDELIKLSDATRAVSSRKFFQAFPGGYGEGDDFIGVTVPDQRAVSKKFFGEVSLREIELLLNEPIHEFRLTAIFMLVLKFQKSKDEQFREEIVNLYIKNIDRINNWDLVDSSAHLILGPQLKMDNDTGLLYELAQSDNLWAQRIAIIATLHFIRNNQFEDTLKISEMLLNHKHDLIHKAVGWMLREVGNKNYQIEFNFLLKHYKQMPRTMLRYAIEKFSEEIRQNFLKGTL